ncbi:MAG: hypothetical protein HYV67_04835 [Candidatus Taylorbacteria bacterium]|nr:hypothetical protein [Candidatus Taylorbacteria bacterium]
MEKRNRITIIAGIIALVIIIGLLFYAGRAEGGPGKFDGFAQCLKDKGVIFYGAFWCPHCQNQKALFGSSKKYLPYVECSTANSQGQIEICKANKIANYPTWAFADQSTTTGEMALAALSEKTGCELPR